MKLLQPSRLQPRLLPHCSLRRHQQQLLSPPPITRPSLPSTTSPPVQPTTPVAPPAQPAAAPKIGLNVTGPDTAQPGTDIRFILEVTNSGNAPSPELVVTDRYDQGLEYAVKANPLQNKLGVIQPGEKKQVGITFRVTRAGRLCHVVEVTGPGNIHETKQVCVNVTGEPAPPEQPAISLGLATPQKAYTVGQHPLFTIDVTNTGSTTAAQQVRLVLHLDPQLHADQATQGFQRTADGGVQFNIDSIPPGGHEQRQVECTATAPSANACGRVTFSDLSQLNLGQEACLSIQPAPAAAAPQSSLQVQNSGDQQSRESGRQCHVPNYCHECRYESGKKRAFVADAAGIDDLRNESRAGRCFDHRWTEHPVSSNLGIATPRVDSF